MPIKYRLKKFAAAAMALVFLVSFTGIFAPSVDAVTPTYYVSEAYKSSQFYQNLKNYKLTGDVRFDVVSIALSQYGYHEGNDDNDMSGSNLEGFKNFAEYNRMYGKLDNGEGNGMSYGYSWCAAFVSWCLRQAKVSTSVVETFVSCSRAVKNFRSRGIFKEKSSGYIPRAGDIIFFIKPEDAAQGYVASHVGLVIGTDSGFVYTVEGNTDNYCVCQKAYPFDSEKIVGYAVPNYKTLSGTVYDFTQKNDQKFPGTYTVTSENLPVCREINVREDVIGQLTAGTKVEVKEVDLGWGLVDFGGTEGWIYLLHAEREQHTVTLDSNGGVPSLSYQHKDIGVPLDLSLHMPTREGYTLVGWSSTSGGAIEYWNNSLYEADADTTLYAVWRIEEYTVEFLDYDGRSISSNKYTYGTAVTVPNDPARPADALFTYEFSGWDKTVSSIACGNATYRATYKAIPVVHETTAPAPETTVPETTKVPEVTTEEAVPETTKSPESTQAPETAPVEPESTEEIFFTTPETPDELTAPAEEELDIYGCASALTMPAAFVWVFVALICLGRRGKNSD
jgi:uncharacterized repeat protein (TIGR02543 family)